MNEYDIVNDNVTKYVVGPGVTPFKRVSTTDTNAASVKASAGILFSVTVNNVNAAVRYLKFYNKATAPTVGTDVPVLVFPIPVSNGMINLTFAAGIYFSLGIAIGMATGIADNSSTGVTASEHVITLTYL